MQLYYQVIEKTKVNIGLRSIGLIIHLSIRHELID